MCYCLTFLKLGRESSPHLPTWPLQPRGALVTASLLPGLKVSTFASGLLAPIQRIWAEEALHPERILAEGRGLFVFWNSFFIDWQTGKNSPFLKFYLRVQVGRGKKKKKRTHLGFNYYLPTSLKLSVKVSTQGLSRLVQNPTNCFPMSGLTA